MRHAYTFFFFNSCIYKCYLINFAKIVQINLINFAYFAKHPNYLFELMCALL